jgi:hypothetical protein
MESNIGGEDEHRDDFSDHTASGQYANVCAILSRRARDGGLIQRGDWRFSSLRAKDVKDLIINLEQRRAATPWGRLIFYVPDVDEFATYLKDKGFQPEEPRDGSWGER